MPEARSAIAARLGMTPETLSRTLAALEAAVPIRVSPRRIDVPDRETRLRAIPRDPTGSPQAAGRDRADIPDRRAGYSL
jgi:hypothetical protein